MTQWTIVLKEIVLRRNSIFIKNWKYGQNRHSGHDMNSLEYCGFGTVKLTWFRDYRPHGHNLGIVGKLRLSAWIWCQTWTHWTLLNTLETPNTVKKQGIPLDLGHFSGGYSLIKCSILTLDTRSIHARLRLNKPHLMVYSMYWWRACKMSKIW